MNLLELKLERIRQGKTQADVAKGTNMSAVAYGQKERGETEFSVQDAEEVGVSLGLTYERWGEIFVPGILPAGNRCTSDVSNYTLKEG